jgi:hypothetical protein
MAELEDFCYCGHHRTEHNKGTENCWFKSSNIEGDDEIECGCCSFLPKQRCPNLQKYSGLWEDLLEDEIGLYPPLKGYKCKKNCCICHGTGIVPLKVCDECYGMGNIGTECGEIEKCIICNGKGYLDEK